MLRLMRAGDLCRAIVKTVVRVANAPKHRHTTSLGPGDYRPNDMTARPSLIEFPADDPERARRFWSGLLVTELQSRADGEGEGWQTRDDNPVVGVHERGRGPGDSFSLPYFEVIDLAEALNQVTALGGTIVHPGSRWAICKDSEGSPFGLALAASVSATA